MEEYILISQEHYHIMQYAKTEAQKWFLSEYETEDSAVQLTGIDFELQLSEIYTGVDFSEPK